MSSIGYFAAAAMNGMLRGLDRTEVRELDVEQLARESFRIATAMVAEEALRSGPLCLQRLTYASPNGGGSWIAQCQEGNESASDWFDGNEAASAGYCRHCGRKKALVQLDEPIVQLDEPDSTTTLPSA